MPSRENVKEVRSPQAQGHLKAFLLVMGAVALLGSQRVARDSRSTFLTWLNMPFPYFCSLFLGTLRKPPPEHAAEPLASHRQEAVQEAWKPLRMFLEILRVTDGWEWLMANWTPPPTPHSGSFIYVIKKNPRTLHIDLSIFKRLK